MIGGKAKAGGTADVNGAVSVLSKSLSALFRAEASGKADCTSASTLSILRRSVGCSGNARRSGELVELFDECVVVERAEASGTADSGASDGHASVRSLPALFRAEASGLRFSAGCSGKARRNGKLAALFEERVERAETGGTIDSGAADCPDDGNTCASSTLSPSGSEIASGRIAVKEPRGVDCGDFDSPSGSRSSSVVKVSPPLNGATL